MYWGWMFTWGFAVAVAVNSLVLPASAQLLPIRHYTGIDGLPSNEVNCAARDREGYLWFCTGEGLSRFDGYRFQTFGRREGLSSREVTAFLQTRDGSYWVGVANGLCHFKPIQPLRSTGPRFDCQPIAEGEGGRRISALLEDRTGVVWVGSWGGLHRVARVNGHWRLIAVPLEDASGHVPYGSQIRALLEDRQGTIWIGTAVGLAWRWPDGRVERHRLDNGVSGAGAVYALAQDGDGSIWAGGTRLWVMKPSRDPSQWVVGHIYRGDALPSPTITSLFRTSDDTLWVGTPLGLSRRIKDSTGTYRFAPLRESQGLPYGEVVSMTEDAEGGLWAAFSNSNGIVRLEREGFTTFTLGGGQTWVRGFQSDQDGRFVAATGNMLLWQFDGLGFHPPVVPHSLSKAVTSWGMSQIFLHDRQGDWWLPSGAGLYRYAAVKRLPDLLRTPPKSVYRMSDHNVPVPAEAQIILRLFEDSRGDIWIGTAAGLNRWQRSATRLRSYSHEDGIPYRSGKTKGLSMPHSFAEDRQGKVWIGFYPRGLARVDGDQLTFFTPAEGIPDGMIGSLHVDRAGRLWVGSVTEGLVRIDDTTATPPRPIPYTTAEGLSTDSVLSIVEDRAGHIYCGTGKGVDRIDVTSGRIHHYTEADGLPAAAPESAFRDDTGALWFGTNLGAVRLIPNTHALPPPASPQIRAIRISGVPRPVSDMGETFIGMLSLEPGENHVEIEYSSLRPNPGEHLKYQVRLARTAEWSKPTEERVVNYAQLGWGRYQFEVRAINEDDIASANSATVAFTIAAPLWMRPWFGSVIAIALCAILYSFYRYRVSYLLALERMRTDLAIDLHDEVGAGLAEIAVSSEVARQDASPPAAERLAGIAERCRELRSSMADIVWAVDPSKDKVADLVGRMKQVTRSVLEEGGCRVEFRATAVADAASATLTPKAKRHILMVAKETVTNVARHSGATDVQMITDMERGMLRLSVRDNGRGFNPELDSGGNGLRNLRRRSVELRGTLRIESAPGSGCTVELLIPLRRRRSLVRPWMFV